MGPTCWPKLLGISLTPGPSDLKQAASQLGQQVLDILEPFQGDIVARTLGMFVGKMRYGMSAIYGGMVISLDNDYLYSLDRHGVSITSGISINVIVSEENLGLAGIEGQM